MKSQGKIMPKPWSEEEEEEDKLHERVKIKPGTTLPLDKVHNFIKVIIISRTQFVLINIAVFMLKEDLIVLPYSMELPFLKDICRPHEDFFLQLNLANRNPRKVYKYNLTGRRDLRRRTCDERNPFLLEKPECYLSHI